MKTKTAETLIKLGIIEEKKILLIRFIPAAIWVAIVIVITMLDTMEFDLSQYQSNTAIVIKIIVAGYFIICPIFYAKEIFVTMIRLSLAWAGIPMLAIIAILFSAAFAVIISFLLGAVLLLISGFIRALISLISMSVYNRRLSKINSLSGNLTEYINDSKFMKTIDNIYETIDIFEEYSWITENNFNRFIEQYSLFKGFEQIKSPSDLETSGIIVE